MTNEERARELRECLDKFIDREGEWDTTAEAEAEIMSFLTQVQAEARLEAMAAECHFCAEAMKSIHKWSKATSEGKHFKDDGTEAYCKVPHIAALEHQVPATGAASHE